MIKNHLSAAKRFLDWLGFRLSRSTYVDGLWVGAFSSEPDTEVLSRLCDALLLIKTHDQYRYKRVLNEVERLWAHILPASQGVWDQRLKACVVDARFVLSSPLEFIASAVVHEATHGWLMRRGIGYSQELRHRVEMICLRQELAFAMKLPNGGELQKEIERFLTLGPDLWTDEAFRESRDTGEIEMARHLKIPDWLWRAAQNIRARKRSSHQR